MSKIFNKKNPLVNLWKAFCAEAPVQFVESCTGVVRTIEAWFYDSKHALYGIAVARILFASAALGILFTNFRTRFYTFGSGAAWSGQFDEPVNKFGDIPLFSMFFKIGTNDALLTLYFFVLMVLSSCVLIGYRSRVLLPIFLILWIGLVEVPAFGGDQGDNAMRIAMFLMMFTDHSARWSLDARRRARNENYNGPLANKLIRGRSVLPQELTSLWHNLAIIALACQVFMIYVSGALFKASGESWKDGTAVYGPLSILRFSPWPELNDLVTTFGWAVAVASIGSVILQVVFPGALLFRWTRIPILFAMVSFHFGIALLMGLPWFSLAMVGIDAIFIRDVTWQRVANWFKRAAKGEQQIVKDDEQELAVKDATLEGSRV